jgi:hypothetical protein
MSSYSNWAPWLKRASAATGLLVLAACATPQPMVAAAPPGPIPPGAARIWFYRIYSPSLGQNIANVDLNGARSVSVSASGPPQYRDVTPGHYHIAAETYGTDVNQTRDVDLAPGQEIYVKILDDPTWISGGDYNELHRDTFYVWLMPPQVAKAEMAMSPM